MKIDINKPAKDASDWCFVTGMGSTGTTGLVKILNYHPDICIMQEGWLWGYLQLLNCSHVNIPEISGIHTHCIVNSRINYYHSINYEIKDDEDNYLNFFHHQSGAWSAQGLREIMEGFRRAIAPKHFLFGDKFSGYGLRIDSVNKVFPNFKNLLTIRNIWDHISGIKKSSWFNTRYKNYSSKKALKEAIKLGLYSKIKEKENNNFEENITCNIHFGDLAFSPKKTISKILSFLGMEENKMNWDVLDNVYYKDSMGRWKKDKDVVEVKNYLDKSFCLESLNDIELYNEKDLKEKKALVLKLLGKY
jgi:hypothetical protein